MHVIGPYRVIEEIARGGMGVIYRAVGPGQQLVALKLLLAQRANNPRARARFLLEAKTLARLRHPNVVAIHQVGEFQGAPWLALEFVAGESLEDRLRRGPLPIHAAVRVAQQLAQALHYVHGCGVLHRDLKPANVLLQGDRALLTDFGLSQDEDASQGGVTRSGVSLGTPGYWAPEQAQGLRVAYGPHTDLYGLGAVLYACLTGRPPVQAVSLQQYLEAAQVQTVRPPHVVRPDVPQWVSALCMRCLALAPEDRPASAEGVARDLVLGEGAAQAKPRRALGALVGVAGVLLCVAVGVGWWALQEDGAGEGSPARVASKPSPRTVEVVGPQSAEPSGQPEDARRDEAEALLVQARALLAEGRQEEAMALLTRAEELAGLRDAYEVHGGVLGMLERYPETIAHCDRALARHPDHGPFYLARALARIELRQHEAALSDLERAEELSPENLVAAFFHGEVLAKLGHYTDAAAAYDRTLAIDPRYVQAYANRARVRTALGRLGEAFADCDRALELDPSRASVHVNRGIVQLSLGRPQEAIGDYTRALELAPGDPDTFHHRAVALRRLGRNAAAIEDCDRAIGFDATDPAYFETRGAAKEASGKLAAAIDDYDRAIALDPRANTAHFNRGVANHQLSRYEEAIGDYDRSLALQPRDSAAYVNRGFAKHHLGRYADAIADYDRALGLDLDAAMAEDLREARAKAVAGRGL